MHKKSKYQLDFTLACWGTKVMSKTSKEVENRYQALIICTRQIDYRKILILKFNIWVVAWLTTYHILWLTIGGALQRINQTFLSSP